MRKISILLFLFLSVCGFSQGLNADVAIDDNYDQQSMAVLCANEYNYLAVLSPTSGSFFSSTLLHKLDTMGNELWTMDLRPGNYETTFVTDMYMDHTGSIYVFGWAAPICDVISNYIGFVQKVSPSGQLIWMKKWEENFDPWTIHNSFTLVGDSLPLLCVQDSGITKAMFLSNQGLVSDSFLLIKDHLNKVLYDNESYYFACTDSSLYRFDSTGLIIGSLQFASKIKGLEIDNDSLYLLTMDSIFVLDSNLQVLSSKTFGVLPNLDKLKVVGNQVFLLNQKFHQQEIYSLNKQLQLNGTKIIPEVFRNSMKIDYNELHCSYVYEHQKRLYKTIRVLDYSMNSDSDALIETPDVGIVDLITTSVEAYPDYYEDVYRTYASGKVLVKNYGQYTVSSLKVNHFNYWGICSDLVYNQEFVGLSLAPGDSVWLNLGQFHYHHNYFSGDSILLNVCIYTSHPNRMVDTNSVNDFYCEEVLFGMVDIKNLQADKELIFFPNPTEGSLYLKTEISEHTLYQIYALEGQLIEHGELTSTQIDISSLPSGVYWIQLIIEGQSPRHQKIIKI
jgi:hypothetical protein